MQVEGSRHTISFTRPERRPNEAVREDAKVRSSGRRDGHSEPTECRQWKLGERAGWTRDPVRASYRTGVAVAARTTHREEARVVPIPLLEEHIERPLEARDDREAGRTKAEHGYAGEALQILLRPPHRCPELVGPLCGHAAVIPPVRSDLVPLTLDFPDHFRQALRQPPENEEGTPGVVAGQRVQQWREQRRRAEREPVQVASPDRTLECGDLEVLLHVHGEVMAHSGGIRGDLEDRVDER